MANILHNVSSLLRQVQTLYFLCAVFIMPSTASKIKTKMPYLSAQILTYSIEKTSDELAMAFFAFCGVFRI